MRQIVGWIGRLTNLFARRHDRELGDELASHLQMHIDDNVRLGMAPDEARRVALARLGGLTVVEESCREQAGVPLLAHVGQDVRYALRALRRSPGFTIVAVVTIALGIFGPTVTFTMAKAWIFDPLPFAHADELLDVRGVDENTGNTSSLNPADFLDYQRTAASLDHLAGYRRSDVRLTGADRAERVRGADVTPGFFHVLGTQALYGRVFEPRFAGPEIARQVVVGHAMWRERLRGDPQAVGRTVRLDGEDYTVIGILPETFQFTLLGRIDVWRPIVFAPNDAVNRRPRSLTGVARLRPGRSFEGVRAELVQLASGLASTHPDTNAKRGVQVRPLAAEIRRHHDLGFIVDVMFAMVGCVLLIACVNVTNVMLARASTRRQEMAVRLALGASRWRIVRQWMVEHVMLFVFASAIGAALAVYGAGWITESIPVENRQYLRNHAALPVDRTVVLFALAVGAMCGVGFGWLPAWTGTTSELTADLRDASARMTPGRAGMRLRTSLVVCEVALALAVLIGAALLVQTARNIARVDLGFDPRNVLTFAVSLDPQRYSTPASIQGFYDRLLDDLAGRTGVTSAAAGSRVPFTSLGGGTEVFFEGEPEPRPADTPGSALNLVTPGYADTLRLRIVSGRLFADADGPDAPKVAVINQTFAARHFPGRDALGRRLRVTRGSTEFWTIVGVVADVKNDETIDPPEPQLYLPFAQRPVRSMTIVLRSPDPESLIGAARTAVAALDPAEPTSEMYTMPSLIERVTGPYRSVSTFVAFFGAVTLLLAGVGVYGVISYSFARRTREIGIRMALGARRADVAGLVVGEIRTIMGVAIVPGLVLAALFGNAMKAMLFGVTASDWRWYLAMTLVLAAVTLVAAAVPARRAISIDPMRALRYE